MLEHYITYTYERGPDGLEKIKYRYTIQFETLAALERFERFQYNEDEFNYHYDRVQLQAWTYCDEGIFDAVEAPLRDGGGA